MILSPGLKPKKSLGQNFFINNNLCSKIADRVLSHGQERIVEVGPGKGALTRYLIERKARVTAVEIDKRMCEYLQERFGQEDNLKLVCADILSVDIEKYFLNPPYVLCGNLPFYNSSQIIARFVKKNTIFKQIVVTIQKELAERIVSQGERNSSSLSILVAFFSKPRIVLKISKNSFNPRPKVDAALLELDVLSPQQQPIVNHEIFFPFIRHAFAYRRKTILNSLKKAYPELDLKSCLRNAGISEGIRPEMLVLDDFVRLSNEIEKNFRL